MEVHFVAKIATTAVAKAIRTELNTETLTHQYASLLHKSPLSSYELRSAFCYIAAALEI